jgi:PAS domain S-box-containing protein
LQVVTASPAQSHTLTEAEAKLIESLPQPIVCCHPDGTLLLANTAAQHLLGQPSEQLQVLFSSAFDGAPTPQLFELSVRVEHGDPLDVQVMSSVLTDENANPRLLLLTLTDMSAQKRAEREQHQLAQALRDTAAELSRSLDLESVLKAILNNVGQVVPHQAATILLIEGTTARCALHRGYSEEAAKILMSQPLSTSLPNLQRMQETQEACLIPDVQLDGEWRAFERFEWIRSYLATPICAYNRVIGFLNLQSDQPNAFAPIHAERLRIFSDQAAIAIENAQLYEAMYRDASELRALNRATAFLFTLSPRDARSVQEVAQRIATMVVGEFDGVDCGVLLLHETTRQLECAAHFGDLKIMHRVLDIQNGRGLISASIHTDQTIYVPDVRLDARYIVESERVRSEMVVPLRTANGLIGVLDLQSDQVDMFSLEDRYLLEAFAPYAAATIDNVRLYHRVQQHADKLEETVAERTLEAQRARRRVEAILNHSSDGIVMTHPDGAIQQSNDAFNQMFGYGTDEVYDLPFTACAEARFYDPLQATFREVAERGQPGRIEIVAQRRDGTMFDADVMLSPLTNPNGRVTNLVCSLRDISRYKQLERDLRAALLKERTLNQLRARFVTRVSHEFRTPLAVIQTASDLLQRYYLRMTAEQRSEKLERIHESIQRITSILDDLLWVNHSKAGHGDFRPVTVNLELFALEYIARVREEDGNRHPINFSVQGDCTSQMLDSELIARIVSHLLSNALKYSPVNSPVEFLLTCEGVKTVIYVKDQGIGIPVEDHPHLFEPFFRAQNVQDTEGVGLGLAIVKEAVELHGGSIEMDSQLGKGTSFTVTLLGVEKGAS